jgi:hypothetical protein
VRCSWFLKAILEGEQTWPFAEVGLVELPIAAPGIEARRPSKQHPHREANQISTSNHSGKCQSLNPRGTLCAMLKTWYVSYGHLF